MHQGIIDWYICVWKYHIYLLWVQKCNVVTSGILRPFFLLKGKRVLFTLVRFEIDYHRYTDVPQVIQIEWTIDFVCLVDTYSLVPFGLTAD